MTNRSMIHSHLCVYQSPGIGIITLSIPIIPSHRNVIMYKTIKSAQSKKTIEQIKKLVENIYETIAQINKYTFIT